MMRRAAKGFTLIELLVVISIIGLLATIIFTSLLIARGKARDANRVATLIQIAKLVDLSQTDTPQAFTTDAAGTIPCPSHSLLSDCQYSGGKTNAIVSQIKDPSGSNTPCPTQWGTPAPGTGPCNYSISRNDGTASAGGSPNSQDWQVCAMLEFGNAAYNRGGAGGTGYTLTQWGEVHIGSDTNGTIVAGCR